LSIIEGIKDIMHGAILKHSISRSSSDHSPSPSREVNSVLVRDPSLSFNADRDAGPNDLKNSFGDKFDPALVPNNKGQQEEQLGGFSGLARKFFSSPNLSVETSMPMSSPSSITHCTSSSSIASCPTPTNSNSDKIDKNNGTGKRLSLNFDDREILGLNEKEMKFAGIAGIGAVAGGITMGIAKALSPKK